MQLYIGNKNYSSWSLRPWLLMQHTGNAFEEIRLQLDFTDGSPFKQAIAHVSPAGRVPVLVDDGFAIWDTMAICEYLAEQFGEKRLWPSDRLARARARSLCAEMHGGFGALRSHFPMNIEAALPEVGPRLLREVPGTAADLARIVDMWSGQLAQSGGPHLFGEFGIADAYFAPVCFRIETYGLPVPARIRQFIDHMLGLPAMRAWAAAARAEHQFLPDDEPYRTSV